MKYKYARVDTNETSHPLSVSHVEHQICIFYHPQVLRFVLSADYMHPRVKTSRDFACPFSNLNTNRFPADFFFPRRSKNDRANSDRITVFHRRWDNFLMNHPSDPSVRKIKRNFSPRKIGKYVRSLTCGSFQPSVSFFVVVRFFSRAEPRFNEKSCGWHCKKGREKKKRERKYRKVEESSHDLAADIFRI